MRDKLNRLKKWNENNQREIYAFSMGVLTGGIVYALGRGDIPFSLQSVEKS